MDSKEQYKANALESSTDSVKPIRRQRRTSPNRSQETTVLPTLKLLAYVQSEDDIQRRTMEFHMTIRTRVSELTPKQASMLLSISVARAVFNGVDYTLYMSMEFLFNFLKKSGVDVLFIKNEKVRQTVLLAELVLTEIRGKWLNFIDVEELPKDVAKQILATEWLPSDRTLNSWKQHWDLERYLQVRIVPVEHYINRVESTAERYSGYTRGYGNDGSPPEPGKTRPSAELDGEDFVELPPRITLQELDKYNAILSTIEFGKAKKKQE